MHSTNDIGQVVPCPVTVTVTVSDQNINNTEKPSSNNKMTSPTIVETIYKPSNISGPNPNSDSDVHEKPHVKQYVHPAYEIFLDWKLNKDLERKGKGWAKRMKEISRINRKRLGKEKWLEQRWADKWYCEYHIYQRRKNQFEYHPDEEEYGMDEDGFFMVSLRDSHLHRSLPRLCIPRYDNSSGAMEDVLRELRKELSTQSKLDKLKDRLAWLYYRTLANWCIEHDTFKALDEILEEQFENVMSFIDQQKNGYKSIEGEAWYEQKRYHKFREWPIRVRCRRCPGRGRHCNRCRSICEHRFCFESL